VDRIVDEWHAERPDLDVEPVKVLTRLARVRTLVDDELAAVFDRYDLGPADFTVIAALRRAGEPYTLPQSELMARLGLTSGTVSVRLGRLEAKGVVTRKPSAADGRGVLVTLTSRGVDLFDQVAPRHLANEDVLLSTLTASERDQLAALLRKLLVEFEGSRPDAGPAPLGLTVVPAFVGMAMRESVGLPAVAALLVRAVDQGGAACAAGVRTGDVLLRAGGRELRSVESLYAALADASDRLELRVLRGTEETDLIVPVPAGLGRATTCGRGAAAEHAL
jgi:DNA-binding MarR family transcriptional regulator